MINPETVKVYNFFERVDNLKRNLCRLQLKEKHKQKEKIIPLYQMYSTKGELTLTYSNRSTNIATDTYGKKYQIISKIVIKNTEHR